MGNAYKLNWHEEGDEPDEIKLTRWDKIRLGMIAALLGAIFEQTVLSWLMR